MSKVYTVIGKVKPGNYKGKKNVILYRLNKSSDSA